MSKIKDGITSVFFTYYLYVENPFMNMNKLLKSSIEITGKIPLLLKNKLESAGVLVDGLITGGNNINVTLNSKGTETTVEATFVGNGKWVIDNLDDSANLFPEIEEGDSVSADMFTKLFMNSINSGLILSFNPLGEVKYGIKDKIDNLKEKAQKVKDWANNTLYAEDAEKWIRGNGPYRRTFTDARDGQTRTKKDYSAGRINVGKIQQLNDEGKGHYKVLTGNPATQDFQVWHLYKNGNKIRCLDLKTGLKPQEAEWVYDNNIPDSWSEADWNPEGEIPEKASKIEIQEVPQTEEDNVTETEESQTTEDNADTTEEDNVTEENSESEEIEQVEEDNIGNPDEWWDESDTDGEWNEDMEYIQMDEEDNVTEEPKKKKKEVTAAFIKSSEDEEDNVIESKPKKKSKYNGKNVTGYQDGMLGTMAVASSLISCSLILSKIEDFQNYIKQYKLGKKPKQVLTEILTRLRKLPAEDRNNITKDSNNNVLIINFGNTDLTTENYMAQFEIYDDDVVSKVNLGKGNSMTGDDAIRMCTQTLDSIVNP